MSRADFRSNVENAMLMNIVGAPPIYMKLNVARKAFVKKVRLELDNLKLYRYCKSDFQQCYFTQFFLQTIVLTVIKQKTKQEWILGEVAVYAQV